MAASAIGSGLTERDAHGRSTRSSRTRSSRPGRAARNCRCPARLMRLLPVYGLVILTVLLALFFSLLLPATFPTMLNARSIISDKSIIAILSLAAMIPMVTGKIDLTIGYGIVLWHILVISLQEWFGVPWPLPFSSCSVSARRLGCSTDCSSNSPRSTASSRRSAPARCSTRSPCGTRKGHQIMGALPDGFLAISVRALAGSADHRLLRARSVVCALVHPRISADRPVSLCDRREPEGGGAERHSRCAAIPCSPSWPRGADGGRGRDARLQAQSGTGERRPRIPPAGAGRRLPRIDDDQARALQRLGNAGRRRRSWRSAFPASSNSAANSGSSRSSTARP